MNAPQGQKPVVWGHVGNDWCHLCGVRRDKLADVWYPDNAEHHSQNRNYIRICSVCSVAIAAAANGAGRTTAELDAEATARPAKRCHSDTRSLLASREVREGRQLRCTLARGHEGCHANGVTTWPATKRRRSAP